MPWTKLGFEPVVITINTMEVILSLTNSSDNQSEAGSVSTTSTTSNRKDAGVKKNRSRKKLQDAEVPPGYVQSLLNRLVLPSTLLILKRARHTRILVFEPSWHWHPKMQLCLITIIFNL